MAKSMPRARAVEATRPEPTVVLTPSAGPPGRKPPLSPVTPRRRGEEIPTHIDGYEILDLLGGGGMGTVYLVFDPLLGRVVALKLLDPLTPDQTGSAPARFLREAVLSGRLAHAGIVPIYRVGFDKQYGYYYCMRFLQGRTLDAILRARIQNARAAEEFSLTRLLNLLTRVCEAIAHAHRHGVLHRDLKPANIMLTDAGEVFVLDWGLAKDLGASGSLSDWRGAASEEARAKACLARHRESTKQFLTRPCAPSVAQRLREFMTGRAKPQDDEPPVYTLQGMVAGTPQYMSPEQCRGEKALTPASDVYALGTILYQILTGQLPVEDSSPSQVLLKTSLGEVRHLQDLPEIFHLPEALSQIVRRALSLKAADRYADAGGLAEAIRLYLEGQPPLVPIAAWDFGQEVGTGWEAEPALPASGGQAVLCPPGTVIRCAERALGDFLCRVGFRACEGRPWCLAVYLDERDRAEPGDSQYEIRLGTGDRHYLELFEKGRRKQRRFDLHLQTERDYELEVELESEHLIVRLDGQPCLTYAELFPLIGGAVSLQATAGDLMVQRAEMHSRGAPLRLSFLSLPDRLYRQGRYVEAREMYRQVAESHPGRPEGLQAVYKLGLCEAEMKDTQRAFQTFTQLESTMYGHYAVLGLARIGTLADDPAWAWEALKNGYLQYAAPDARTEFWFALLEIVESLGEAARDEQLRRYRELLSDLAPGPQEAGQVTFEFLDLVERHLGLARLRQEAVALLQARLKQKAVDAVAILALWRQGLDEVTGAEAQRALYELPVEIRKGPNQVRFLLLGAELMMAAGLYAEARGPLGEALKLAGPFSPDSYWARGWRMLASYLEGRYDGVLEEAQGMTEYARRPAMRQVAYLKLVLALAHLALGKKKRGVEILEETTQSKSLWGGAARCVVKKTSIGHWNGLVVNANPLTEAFWLIGEAHRRLGRRDLAMEHFAACEAHPSGRALTCRLARERLARLDGESRKSSRRLRAHGESDPASP
jgi:serine/threonine protein kinase